MGHGLAHGQGPAQSLTHQVFEHGRAHVPAHEFARVAVKPGSQLQPAAALFGQIHNVAHPDLVGSSRGGLRQQAIRGGPHVRVGVGGARHKRAGLLDRIRRARRPAAATCAEYASDMPGDPGRAVRPVTDGCRSGPNAKQTLSGQLLAKLALEQMVDAAATHSRRSGLYAALGRADARARGPGTGRCVGKYAPRRLAEDDQGFF